MPTFSLSDPIFWIQFFYYFVVVFIAYYIPGSLLLRKVILPWIFKISVSVTLGMVLLAYQGYLFGILHIRYLTYIYLLVCFVMWLIGQWKKKRPDSAGQFSMNSDIKVINVQADAISEQVFEDLIESTQAGAARFNVLAAPYR